MALAPVPGAPAGGIIGRVRMYGSEIIQGALADVFMHVENMLEKVEGYYKFVVKMKKWKKVLGAAIVMLGLFGVEAYLGARVRIPEIIARSAASGVGLALIDVFLGDMIRSEKIFIWVDYDNKKLHVEGGKGGMVCIGPDCRTVPDTEELDITTEGAEVNVIVAITKDAWGWAMVPKPIKFVS